MKTSLIVAAALSAACSSSTPPPRAPAAPAPQPAVAPAPTIVRIAAGGVPGSNTHRWGSRSYELRAAGGVVELRLHDAIDFQGSGMQPKDMAPTRHTCSRWEPVPAVVLATLPASGTCADLGTTCADLERWLKATSPPPRSTTSIHAAAFEPDTTFGRGAGGC